MVSVLTWPEASKCSWCFSPGTCQLSLPQVDLPQKEWKKNELSPSPFHSDHDKRQQTACLLREIAGIIIVLQEILHNRCTCPYRHLTRRNIESSQGAGTIGKRQNQSMRWTVPILPSSLVPQPSLWPLKATISNSSYDTQSKFTNKKQLDGKYESKKEGRTMKHVTACPLVLDHQLLQIQLLATRELLELCQKPLVFPGKNQLSLSLSLSLSRAPGPPHERAWGWQKAIRDSHIYRNIRWYQNTEETVVSKLLTAPLIGHLWTQQYKTSKYLKGCVDWFQ